jgi:hypothetical protein
MTDDEKTIEEMRERLAHQILEIALESDNPQLKLDAFKATEKSVKIAAAKPANDPSAGGMAVFQRRMKAAAGQGDDDDE